MTIGAVSIKGYRSVRKLYLPLRQLTVLVGGNGAGKTNLYRSIELLHHAATGGIAQELAREGGLSSVFWAGGRNLGPDGGFDPKYRTDGYRQGEKARLELEARLDIDDFLASYRIELGYPTPNDAAFGREALVKSEVVELRDAQRATRLMERTNHVVWARDDNGAREVIDQHLLASETALSTLRIGRAELAAVRRELGNARFFHGFRTDADSPLRRPARAVTSPLLASDGANLAAVFATLRYIREETADLDQAIALAFPGAQLIVPPPEEFATFGMVFPETPKRTFWAHELSDGTLQFLALMGALLSYRLPSFVALNEPESSLHPGLLPALAQTVVRAGERAQIWVVTHSAPLAAQIEERSGSRPLEVVRDDDGTSVRGLNALGQMAEE